MNIKVAAKSLFISAPSIKYKRGFALRAIHAYKLFVILTLTFWLEGHIGTRNICYPLHTITIHCVKYMITPIETQPLKRQSQLQQTTNLIFATSFLKFRRKIRYDIACESSASRWFSWNIMPYLLFLKKQQNLKLSPAANYRWRFKG